MIEIPSAQNLVCAIIVHPARNEAARGGWGGGEEPIAHDAFIVFKPNTHQAPQQPLPLYNGPHQITTHSRVQHSAGSCTNM